MPTLLRLLFVIAVVLALGYGAMLAMVSYLAPHPREISQPVELPKAR